jgi:uncharacterized membrane protein YebE (DUF533 family)
MAKKRKKMSAGVRKYLAALKRAKSLGHVDKKERAAIRRYHGV